MARYDRTGERLEQSIPITDSPCLDCTSDDPQCRSAHQLLLARQGLDALRSHLQQHHAQKLSTDRRHESITSICTWISQQMQLYKSFVHPTTGAPLSWWDARVHCHQATNDTKPDQEHLDAAWHTNQEGGRMPIQDTKHLITAALEHPATDPWAHGHILLMESGLGHKDNFGDTAALCRQFAKHWPQDARDWEIEAQWWEAGAVGTCSFERQPGEEG